MTVIVVLALVAGGVTAAFLLRSSPPPPKPRSTDALHKIERFLKAARTRLVGSKTIRLSLSRALPGLSLSQILDLIPELNPQKGRGTPDKAGAPSLRAAGIPQTGTGSGAEAPAAEDPASLQIIRKTTVDTGHAIFTAEPTVASNGTRVMVTWNFGAAFSTDNGSTFRFVAPSEAFPDLDGGFCCDQLAYYIPAQDLWVWVLQYKKNGAGDNHIRVAVAKGDAAFDAAKFTYWDWSPQSFGLAEGTWFDNSRLSASNAFVYVAANAFPATPATPGTPTATPTDAYHGAYVMRFPIAELVAGQSVVGHGLRVGTYSAAFARGSTDTMYFASHISDAVLRVFSWPDNATGATQLDVTHPAYPHLSPYSCPRTGAQPTADWCNRPGAEGGYANDDRLQAGWISNGMVGFAWNASQDPANGFPYPFVAAVRLKMDTLQLVDEPIIWSNNVAYQYPALAPNATRRAGGVMLMGGGTAFQTCEAVVEDPASPSGWTVIDADVSDSDSSHPEAGDYLGVWGNGGTDTTWSGACMTVHGGSDYANVSIQFVSFGLTGQG